MANVEALDLSGQSQFNSIEWLISFLPHFPAPF